MFFYHKESDQLTTKGFTASAWSSLDQREKATPRQMTTFNNGSLQEDKQMALQNKWLLLKDSKMHQQDLGREEYKFHSSVPCK